MFTLINLPYELSALQPVISEQTLSFYYQNRRAAHLSALWDIINWQEIDRRYTNITD